MRETGTTLPLSRGMLALSKLWWWGCGDGGGKDGGGKDGVGR